MLVTFIRSGRGVMQEVQRTLRHCDSERRWRKLNVNVACVVLGPRLQLLQVCGKGGSIGNIVCAHTRFAVTTL